MANIIIKGSHGMSAVGTVDYLLKKHIVTLEGEITDAKANEIVRQLMILGAETKDKITIMIDSPGGSVGAGFAIIDTMRLLGDRIVCVCTGMAASMAAVIFSEGSERLMLPHSVIMIHQTRLSGHISGGSETIDQISRRLTKNSTEINSLLAKNTGKTIEEIEKASAYDNYMSAEEAIAFGIADKVADRFEMIMEVNAV